VARQVWRAFCRPAGNFIAFWRGGGTIFINEPEIVQVDETGRGQWRSDRGTNCLEGRK